MKNNIPSTNLEQEIGAVKKEIELEIFESKLAEGGGKKVDIGDVDSMTGYEFEKFLGKLFKKMGYSVEQTKLSGDQGGDLVISKFGERTAVQAKRSIGSVTNIAVQEVLGARGMYKCERGMVVTTGKFTSSAEKLAIANHIELVNRHKLKSWIEKYL